MCSSERPQVSAVTQPDSPRSPSKWMSALVAAMTTSLVGGVACGLARYVMTEGLLTLLVLAIFAGISFAMLAVRVFAFSKSSRDGLLSAVVVGLIAGPAVGVAHILATFILLAALFAAGAT